MKLVGEKMLGLVEEHFHFRRQYNRYYSERQTK